LVVFAASGKVYGERGGVYSSPHMCSCQREEINLARQANKPKINKPKHNVRRKRPQTAFKIRTSAQIPSLPAAAPRLLVDKNELRKASLLHVL
jgi:hypothetical protein